MKDKFRESDIRCNTVRKNEEKKKPTTNHLTQFLIRREVPYGTDRFDEKMLCHTATHSVKLMSICVRMTYFQDCTGVKHARRRTHAYRPTMCTTQCVQPKREGVATHSAAGARVRLEQFL